MNNLEQAKYRLTIQEANEKQKKSLSKSITNIAPPLTVPQNFNHRQWQITTSAKLKTIRQSYGWSQRELAAKSNVSQATISRAEQNLWISLYTLNKVIEQGLNKKLIIQ